MRLTVKAELSRPFTTETGQRAQNGGALNYQHLPTIQVCQYETITVCET